MARGSRLLASLTACLALGVPLLSGAPAGADTHDASSRDLADQVESSRAAEAGTAVEVGRIEAQLAAASARSDRLATQLGQAVEAYNGAQLRLAEARSAAAAAQRDVVAARVALETSREAVGRFAAQAYRSGGDLGSLSVVLVASGPRDLITRASALQSLAAARTRALERFRAGQAYAHSLQRRADRLVTERRQAARAVAAAKSAAEARLASHTRAVAEISAQRDGLVRELAAARNTTVRLERARQDALERERAAAAAREAEARAREQARLAEERRKAEAARLAAEEAARQAEAARKAEQDRRAREQKPDPPQPARSDPPAQPDPPAQSDPPPAQPAPAPDPAPAPSGPPAGTSSGTSSGAAAAIDFARAQIGKPYRWAADGPDSYDCSGLTMRAWQQGGVSLPHYSVAQYERAQKVSLTDVRPGDLVFFASNSENYRTIYHVGLYIGDGQMIEAPYTGEDVRVSSIWRGSLFGAARP